MVDKKLVKEIEESLIAKGFSKKDARRAAEITELEGRRGTNHMLIKEKNEILDRWKS